MASYSRMITSLESARELVNRLGHCLFKSDDHVTYSMKIGIRNLKSLIVCLGKLDDDVALRIERIYPMLVSYEKGLWEPQFLGSSVEEVLEELHGVCKWVVAADQLWNGGQMKLAADEAVSIITCVVDSTADFLAGLSENPFVRPMGSAFEVLDSFGVQMKFIKHLLRFAMQAGVEELLLFHIQPIAINAATVFSRGSMSFADHIDLYDNYIHQLYPYLSYFVKWSKEAKSKCCIVNRMAADPSSLPGLRSSSNSHTTFSTLPTVTYDEEETFALGLAAMRNAPTHDDEEEQKEEEVDDWGEEEEDILKALLDSFISLLWDILRRQSESRFKDQYRLTFEKLRFSSSIWKKNGMDKNMRGDIGVLICDAGAFIFLLHQTDDPGRFLDLLERFDVLHAKVDHVDQVMSSTGDSTSIKVPVMAMEGISIILLQNELILAMEGISIILLHKHQGT